MVFLIVQNLVEIETVVLIICKSLNILSVRLENVVG